MPFSIPTLQQIADRIESDFETRISGATTFLKRSVLKVQARVYAGAVRLLYTYQLFQSNQLFATSADGEKLETHGAEFGIQRTAAVKATGSGTASGTVGTAITIGSELESATGEVYEIDTGVSIGSGGTVTVDFTANTAGADWNDDSGTTLTFVSPIIGVNTSVTVDANGISNGADEETDGAYRQRILNRKRQPPHGGAEFDYAVWAKEVSGVTRAWSIPLYQGIGTEGVSFVRDNDTDIIPSASEIDTVRGYIISHTDPVTGKTVGYPVGVQLFMITPTKLTVDFTIQLKPNTASVQASVESFLTDLFLVNGGAEKTIYLSQMNEAIGNAAGEEYHILDIPTGNSTATATQVHVLGTITFSTL